MTTKLDSIKATTATLHTQSNNQNENKNTAADSIKNNRIVSGQNQNINVDLPLD